VSPVFSLKQKSRKSITGNEASAAGFNRNFRIDCTSKICVAKKDRFYRDFRATFSKSRKISQKIERNRAFSTRLPPCPCGRFGQVGNDKPEDSRQRSGKGALCTRLEFSWCFILRPNRLAVTFDPETSIPEMNCLACTHHRID